MNIQYSIILPIYNEQGNLKPLIEEIIFAMSSLDSVYEIICVDDHSTDGSVAELTELAAIHASIHIKRHVKNFGQSAALASGLQQAEGDIVITMDSDGQNDPADIPLLVSELKNNVDAVCGVRLKRQDSRVRSISSRVANSVRNKITGDTFKDSGCNFRVMLRHTLNDIPVFNGMHRFIPLLLSKQGYSVLEVPISHRPRVHGRSKYGIRNRMLRGMVDCFAIRWWMKRAIPSKRLIHD